MPHSIISDNNIFTIGLNYRYGGPIYNFFVEIINDVRRKNVLDDVVTSTFVSPTTGIPLPIADPATIKYSDIDPYTINVGGDWRISRNVILNYGIRCIFNSSFKATSFVPVANIACMMR
jgi:hypothetical protein